MIDLQDIGREIALAVDQHAQHSGSPRHVSTPMTLRSTMRTPPMTLKFASRYRGGAGGRLEEGDVENEPVQRLAPELDEVDAVQRMRGIAQNARAPLVVAPATYRPPRERSSTALTPELDA